MTTEVHKLDPGADDADAVHRAAECLARGGLVAFPTETVYGLGVNAANPEAVALNMRGMSTSDTGSGLVR